MAWATVLNSIKQCFQFFPGQRANVTPRISGLKYFAEPMSGVRWNNFIIHGFIFKTPK